MTRRLIDFIALVSCSTACIWVPSSGDWELSWNMIGRQRPLHFHPNQIEDVIWPNYRIFLKYMYSLVYDTYLENSNINDGNRPLKTRHSDHRPALPVEKLQFTAEFRSSVSVSTYSYKQVCTYNASLYNGLVDFPQSITFSLRVQLVNIQLTTVNTYWRSSLA